MQKNCKIRIFYFTDIPKLIEYRTLNFFKTEMQKTKKSIVKRFKITASGKVMRRSPGKRHLLSAKTIKQKRAMGHDKEVTPGVAANVKKAMPFA